MAGFDNNVMYADNVDFTGSINPSAKVTVAGKLMIGTGSTPAIDIGSLTSPDSSITVGYSSPNVTLQVAGGATTGKTITGNSGGPIAPSSGNWNLLTANSTAKFVGSGSTLTQDFNLSNLVLGSSIPSLGTGLRNTGYGSSSLNNIVNAVDNSCYGYNCGTVITNGGNNALYGSSCGISLTTGNLNSAIGAQALYFFTSGPTNSGSNCAFGYSSLVNLRTGVNNICSGESSGSSYTTSESNNICISNTGVVGESNKIRIGTPGSLTGQQNACYIAGITGVTVSTSAPVAVDANGQLSSLGLGSAGQRLTSTGSGSPTWQNPGALIFTDTTAATLAVNNGYFATAAGAYTLPSSPSQGDMVIVFCDTTGAVVVTASSGKFIRIGSSISSSGGTLTSTARGDSLTLYYRTSGTTWETTASMGNWTVA